MFEIDDTTMKFKRHPQRSRVPADGTYYLAVVGCVDDVMIVYQLTRPLKAGEFFPDVPSSEKAVWLRVIAPEGTPGAVVRTRRADVQNVVTPAFSLHLDGPAFSPIIRAMFDALIEEIEHADNDAVGSQALNIVEIAAASEVELDQARKFLAELLALGVVKPSPFHRGTDLFLLEHEKWETWRRQLRRRARAGLPRPAEGLLESASPAPAVAGSHIFIGHGRSPVWKDLRDFLERRLKLQTDEFNQVSTAGIHTIERLEQMLAAAYFAFIVMTGEDETSEGSKRARQNVVHEAGLFQGRLGFRRAILLVEEGCERFSNIDGLTEIRFPKGNIEAKSEEIRGVLMREGLIKG